MKKIWLLGLGIILCGSLINGILIQNNIGGLLRELMRLVILGSFGLLLFGLFKRSK